MKYLEVCCLIPNIYHISSKCIYKYTNAHMHMLYVYIPICVYIYAYVYIYSHMWIHAYSEDAELTQE